MNTSSTKSSSDTPADASALVRADDLPERLAEELRLHGTERSDGHAFAPELSYGRHFGPAPPTARSAAVILLLFQRHGEWHLPLTVRHADLNKHGGQISLPGGSVDANETTADAALRELHEELGVTRSIELLAALAESYVYVSDFRVTPWLAVTRESPKWQPHTSEVDRVIELPLTALLKPTSIGTFKIQRGPVRFTAPCYCIGEDCVWGATSIILSTLAGVLRRMLEEQFGH
jgi:8-oxo-dGTP pyrophosphatase MutT (NUDIX family)